MAFKKNLYIKDKVLLEMHQRETAREIERINEDFYGCKIKRFKLVNICFIFK